MAGKQQQTEEEKTKLEAEKAAEEAKKLEEAKNAPEKVRVICEGTLGHLLLKKGDVTDDKDYVALLKVKGQKKVEKVK